MIKRERSNMHLSIEQYTIWAQCHSLLPCHARCPPGAQRACLSSSSSSNEGLCSDKWVYLSLIHACTLHTNIGCHLSHERTMGRQTLLGMCGRTSILSTTKPIMPSFDLDHKLCCQKRERRVTINTSQRVRVKLSISPSTGTDMSKKVEG